MSVEGARKFYREYSPEYLRDISRRWAAMYCGCLCYLPNLLGEAPGGDGKSARIGQFSELGRFGAPVKFGGQSGQNVPTDS